MRGHGLDRETADRILDGTAQGAVPAEYVPLAGLLDDARLLGAVVPDPALEAETVRAMRSAVGDALGGKAGRRRPRLVPLGLRVAIAFGALALVATANAAADGPLPDGGVPDAVLGKLGIELEDAEDSRADELERQHEEAKRRAEAAGIASEQAETQPQPGSQQGGTDRARENRERAEAFTTAKKEWTKCVAQMAPLHDPGSGPFDPQEACGPKPKRANDETSSRSGAGDTGRRGQQPDAAPPAHAGPPANAGPKNETTETATPRGKSSSKAGKKPAKANAEPRDESAGPSTEAGPPANAGKKAKKGRGR